MFEKTLKKMYDENKSPSQNAKVLTPDLQHVRLKRHGGADHFCR